MMIREINVKTGQETTRQPTAEEQAVIDAYVPPTALELWEQSMKQSDAILPRWAEDMLVAMNASDFANVDQVTKDKLTAKKNMRSQKPE